MIRTVSAIAATTLLLVACTGSDDAASPVTTESPPTTASPAEATTTTTAPTTTTTTEPTPTTTEFDEAALVAEVEAAYFAAFDASRRAMFDPTNVDLRRSLEDHAAGDVLEFTLGVLDDLVELNAIARENPDFGPSRAEIVGPVRFTIEDQTEASIVVCELNAEWFVEPEAGPNGEDSVLRTDVIRSDLVVLLRKIDGVWRVVEGGGGGDQVGVETCD